jgi:hypothetical protein
MRVAWEKLEDKGPFSSYKTWYARIGPCQLVLREVNPLLHSELWRERHIKGEELFKYDILTYDDSTQPSTRIELETGTISLARERYMLGSTLLRVAQNKVVELARQHPECKRKYQKHTQPGPELLAYLREKILDGITRNYDYWKQQREYWDKLPPSERLVSHCPFKEPVITIGWLLVDLSAYTIDDLWWTINTRRHRQVIQGIVNQLIKQNILTSSMAWDAKNEREVRAYSPTG